MFLFIFKVCKKLHFYVFLTDGFHAIKQIFDWKKSKNFPLFRDEQLCVHILAHYGLHLTQAVV